MSKNESNFEDKAAKVAAGMAGAAVASIGHPYLAVTTALVTEEVVKAILSIEDHDLSGDYMWRQLSEPYAP